MAGLNRIDILGRLGRSPELTFTPSGMAICKFSMATSEKNKQGEEKTEWHRCTAFSKAAELINQYVDKGDELYISGKMTYGKYEKDGHDVYTADILVNQFSFISGKKSGNNQGQQNQGGYQQPNQNQQNNGNQGNQQNSQQQNQGFQGGQQQNQQQQGQQQNQDQYQGGGFTGNQTPPDDDPDIPF